MIDFAKPSTVHSTDNPRDGQASSHYALHFDVEWVEDDQPDVIAPNALNAWFVPIIGVLLMVMAVPMGSNRPIPWALWCIATCLLGTIFALRLLRVEPDRPVRTWAHADLLAIAAIMPVWGLIQILPLGAWVAGLDGLDLGGPHSGTTIALSPDASKLALLRVMTYLGLFVLTLEICGRYNRVRQLTRILFFGITFHAVLAMISLTVLGDRFIWGEKDSYLGWATGTFINRNSFASFIGLGIICGIALLADLKARQSKHRSRDLLSDHTLERIWHWACIALLVTALIASGSRMGQFASLVGAATTALVMSVGAKLRARAEATAANAEAAADAEATADTPLTTAHRSPLRAPLLWSGVVVVGFLGLLLFSGTGERLIFSEADFGSRSALYKNALALVEARPLRGFGLDNFYFAFPLVHDPEVSPAVIWDLAHNTYLTHWIELGVIAGSAPLIALLLAASRLGHAVVHGYERTQFAFAMALGALILAAIHSLADFSFEIQANTALLVVILAIGLSQTPRARAKRSAK